MKQGKRKSRRFFFKIVTPMLMLSILQIVILILIMWVSGVFTGLNRYAYQNVSEKTVYRKNYIENSMNQKTALVAVTANVINNATNELLREEGCAGRDVLTNRELNRKILSESAEHLISLLRRDMVNDAFLILNTGELYDDEEGHKLTGLYFRDMDATENNADGNEDVYVQMGSSEISKTLGLTLDYEWSLYLEHGGRESGNMDFFYQTIDGYRPKMELSVLGRWSPFDKISPSTEPSLKYTVPLVAEDGTVYGVLGIGLLKKTVLASIPASDFLDDSASYVLAYDSDADGTYEPVLYSGTAHVYLVDENTVLNKERPASFGLYNFTSGGAKCIGDIRELTLYSSKSPYSGQKWALISVADRKKTVSISTTIFRLFMVGMVVSLAVGAFLAWVLSRMISQPVTNMLKELAESRKGNLKLKFASSRISEIDDLANSVIELQQQIEEAKDDEYTGKLLKANEALQDAYVAAKEANSAKTDFLSRMSHDIRTPMNAIIGMTALAEANIDDKKKLSGCLKKIDVSSHYLLSLINEVLDMSKIESGKFVLAEEEFDLAEMIDNITELIKPMAKEKQHELKVAVGALSHTAVLGDETRIQQAFVNILSNAVKYTPPGGKIEWTITEKPVNKEKIGCFEFVFRDNGIGMSRDFLQKIYDPFERASDVRVSHETGTGLGMAITKNIIEMMDGDIVVESEQGKGSVFTVTVFLKLQEQDKTAGDDASVDGETPEEAAAHREAGSGSLGLDEISRSDFSGNRVLLVDDNEINREIACEVLQMTGLEVDTAENGQDAVDKFSKSENNYYQMIFMDIQMPILNGYGAAMTIRKLTRKDAATVPIVAMTADAFAEDVKAAKEAGMNDHLAKPLDFNRLLAVLNSYLK